MGKICQNCQPKLARIVKAFITIIRKECSKMQKFHKPKKLKIVLLGNRAVGKSSIIRRFVLDDFPQDLQPTVGVDYMSKTISYEGSEYRLELWDTAGQEKYRSLVKGYLKGAHACVYVYDYKNIHSYMDLLTWVNLFESANPDTHASFIAGNKWDLCSEEDEQEMQKTKSLFSSDKKLGQFEDLPCSAKTSQNINQIFLRVVERVVRLEGFDKKRGSTQIHSKDGDGYMTLRCCQN